MSSSWPLRSLLLIVSLLWVGQQAAAADHHIAWCDWSNLDWTEMKKRVVALNATSSSSSSGTGGGFNGRVQFHAVVDNPSYYLTELGMPEDWGLWAEADLAKRGDALCDMYKLGGGVSSYFEEGLIEDLTDIVNVDKRLKWEQVSFATRRFVAEYQERAIAIPLQIEFPLFYYREDVGIRVPPRTWEEALTIGRALNGTDMNGDGVLDAAFCLDPHLDIGRLALGIIASIMKYQTGDRQGYLYDLAPDDMSLMTPLFDTVGYQEAFRIVREMYSMSKPRWEAEARWNTVVEDYEDGNCSMYLSWAALGGVDRQPEHFIYHKSSVARMPGSTVVYDRTTKQLANCTLKLCPYMESGGINRPSLQAGGERFIVRRNPRNLSLVIDVIAAAVSAIDVRIKDNIPYRDDQHNVSWFVEGGWSQRGALQYLNTLTQTMGSLHMVRYPPIPTFEKTWRLIADALKEAARAGSFSNSTASDAEIAVRLARKVEASNAAAGWPLHALDATMRRGYFLPARSQESKTSAAWIAIPIVLLVVILISVTVISLHQARDRDSKEPAENEMLGVHPTAKSMERTKKSPSLDTMMTSHSTANESMSGSQGDSVDTRPATVVVHASPPSDAGTPAVGMAANGSQTGEEDAKSALAVIV